MQTLATIPQTGNMVLKPEVLKRINTVEHRTQLALILKVGDQTIGIYIRKNDARLTQYSALEYIRKEMDCLEASELLEPQKADIDEQN